MKPVFFFLHPEWFYALIVPALFLLWRNKPLYWPQWISPLTLRYPLLQNLPDAPQTDATNTANRVNPWLFGLFLLLLIVALAEPVKPGQLLAQQNQPQPVDLILLVNTSVSMALRDSAINGQQVDRMRKQVDILSHLVDDFRGERIALVILGRPASLWLPLTTDRSLVKSALGRLQTTLGGRNSDISASLQLIAEKFPPDKNSDGNDKVIIISTDAYQQLGAQAPQQAVKDLRQRGYQLHTLALGSTRFPEHLLGKGHLIYQPVDLALLQQLAIIGKGKMLRASDEDVQQKLLAALDREEKIAASSQPRPLIELYPYPLMLAALLLIWQLRSPVFLMAGKR